jgi:hypothetical protein
VAGGAARGDDAAHVKPGPYWGLRPPSKPTGTDH